MVGQWIIQAISHGCISQPNTSVYETALWKVPIKRAGQPKDFEKGWKSTKAVAARLAGVGVRRQIQGVLRTDWFSLTERESELVERMCKSVKAGGRREKKKSHQSLRSCFKKRCTNKRAMELMGTSVLVS